jgi:hypothetical protein
MGTSKKSKIQCDTVALVEKLRKIARDNTVILDTTDPQYIINYSVAQSSASAAYVISVIGIHHTEEIVIDVSIAELTALDNLCCGLTDNKTIQWRLIKSGHLLVLKERKEKLKRRKEARDEK